MRRNHIEDLGMDGKTIQIHITEVVGEDVD
jgi:hypothetical protein